jgi:hypothetical protein
MLASKHVAVDHSGSRSLTNEKAQCVSTLREHVHTHPLARSPVSNAQKRRTVKLSAARVRNSA